MLDYQYFEFSSNAESGHYHGHENVRKLVLVISFVGPAVFRHSVCKIPQMLHEVFTEKANAFLFRLYYV